MLSDARVVLTHLHFPRGIFRFGIFRLAIKESSFRIMHLDYDLRRFLIRHDFYLFVPSRAILPRFFKKSKNSIIYDGHNLCYNRNIKGFGMDYVLENDFDAAVRIMREGGEWYEKKGLKSYASWNLENLTPKFLLDNYGGGKENFYIIRIDGIPAVALILTDFDCDDDGGESWPAEYRPGTSALYIYKFAVAHRFRGKVPYSELVGKLRQFAKEKGHSFLRMGFDPNLQKHWKFYERLGFDQVQNIAYRDGTEGMLCEMAV